MALSTIKDFLRLEAAAGILLLAAARGCAITITAEGTDERDAVEALSTLVESGFSEDACSA